MRYKVGDEVVLNGHAVVLGRINAVEIIGKEGEGEYEAYITDASNQRMVFNDNHINHEKTAELQKKDKTLKHYQGELEKIVEQRNNDDYTKALMKYGRVEGDSLDKLKESKVLLFHENDKYARHKELTDFMHQTYIDKNKDYGDSFGQTHKKYGPVAGLTRIADKFHRLENIILNDSTIQVEDETVIDTLIDLANYAVMFAMELEEDGD